MVSPNGQLFFFVGGFLVDVSEARSKAKLSELCEAFALECPTGAIDVFAISGEVASLEVGMAVV